MSLDREGSDSILLFPPRPHNFSSSGSLETLFLDRKIPLL